MKRMIAGILFIASAMAITGCETMRGAGKDIEKGGDAIQDVAD